MREGLFINKNRDRWLKNQSIPPEDPDEIATEFTRLVDDLSYAKTFYPDSRITRYLNAQASKIYIGIYQNHKQDRNRLAIFCKQDLPLIMYKHRFTLLWVASLFLTFFFVGYFSSAKDETFVREMLGNDYVNMTEENISKGNPFGVYDQGGEFITWLWILINNVMVSFLYFFRGIFFCFPTIQSLINEGIRLGAFEQMFFAKGLGLQSILTVFIHGTLEISAIVIAGAAGVVLGKSWIFPGTISRLQAFKRGAIEGGKIMIGLVPIFIVAAFFEGFVTRHSTMPVYLSGSILLASAAFIVWYFVLYPMRVHKAFTKAAKEAGE